MDCEFWTNWLNAFTHPLQYTPLRSQVDANASPKLDNERLCKATLAEGLIKAKLGHINAYLCLYSECFLWSSQYLQIEPFSFTEQIHVWVSVTFEHIQRSFTNIYFDQGLWAPSRPPKDPAPIPGWIVGVGSFKTISIPERDSLLFMYDR